MISRTLLISSNSCWVLYCNLFVVTYLLRFFHRCCFLLPPLFKSSLSCLLALRTTPLEVFRCYFWCTNLQTAIWHHLQTWCSSMGLGALNCYMSSIFCLFSFWWVFLVFWWIRHLDVAVFYLGLLGLFLHRAIMTWTLTWWKCGFIRI